MKKIIFRADGDSTIGLGHLYRLFSLVEIIKDSFEFVFLTLEQTTQAVIPKTYKKVSIPKSVNLEAEAEWLSKNYTPQEYIIIADGYQFNHSYQKQLKEKGYKLVYIDDLAQEHMFADVVINHSPYVRDEHYTKEPYTRLALGTKYAMLRPSFLNEAKKKRIIHTVDTAFVCFGGADPNDLTLKAVEGLLHINKFKIINIVLGGAYNHKAISQLQQIHSNRINIYRDLNEEELLELMKRCNFAIAPASTILYELCCVKMPVLSGYYVENQKSMYKGFLEKTVILKGGDFSEYTVSDFYEKTKSAIESNNLLRGLKNQHELFNGNSTVNILALINSLNISFRKAKMDDVLEVFDWSNDPLVRKNSYAPSIIQLENHKLWFKNKINNANTLFLIALVNNTPAGVVRYDIGEKYSVIGILVSEKFRGQKLASQFLIKSANHYFKTNTLPVIAYIKKENKASVKAFKNARYRYFTDEIIKDCPSFVYKLEKQDVK